MPIHGYLLEARSFEKQERVLLEAGYRVVSRLDVPTLLIHGDADRILPYPSTAARLPDMIKDLTFVTVEGALHSIAWTHPEVVDPALLDFVAR